MKKVLITLLAIIIAASLPINAYATETVGNIYTFDGITVKFSADSSLSPEKQTAIAELVVNGTSDSSATTYNLLCTLFGHKTTTESFTIIEHCVRDVQPRCLESLQDVTACSRCDYVTTDVITTYYINCCGE